METMETMEVPGGVDHPPDTAAYTPTGHGFVESMESGKPGYGSPMPTRAVARRACRFRRKSSRWSSYLR